MTGAANGTGDAIRDGAEPVDASALLDRVHELVANARPMPLSSSVLISRDDVIELLDDAIARLPEELRRARWLLKEREEFLAQARRESDEIVETARARAERMVQRTEVVREAERRAQSIVADAEAKARQLRHEAEDYVDQKLAAFEVVLERTAQAARRGREQLQAQVTTPPLSEAGAGLASSGIFDQDEV